MMEEADETESASRSAAETAFALAIKQVQHVSLEESEATFRSLAEVGIERAWITLGFLLENDDSRSDEAQAAYKRAAMSTDPHVAGEAFFRLAQLIELGLHDPATAYEFYERAAMGSTRSVRSHALARLAFIEASRGAGYSRVRTRFQDAVLAARHTEEISVPVVRLVVPVLTVAAKNRLSRGFARSVQARRWSRGGAGAAPIGLE